MRVLLLLLDDDFATRLPLARALRARGDDVLVMTPRPAVLPDGFTRIPWSLERGGVHPLRELRAFAEVVTAYRRYRPDLVHHIAHKPIAYGGLAARALGIPSVNTITGIGYLAFARTRRERFVRGLLFAILRAAVGARHARTIVQNTDDLRTLRAARVLDRATLVRGSGVDLARFTPGPEPLGPPTVVYAGRLLVEKGVGDLATAAALLARRGVEARVILVGDRDPHNRGSIPDAELARWARDGPIECLPPRTDMPDVLRGAAIVCIPSWGEGLPKVLLEAAACGRAIVTTDAPGCREVIRHGIEGWLVPPRDPAALADALAYLLARPQLRAELGRRARTRVEAGLDHASIVAQTLVVYDDATRAACPAAGLALAHRVNAIARRVVYRSSLATRLVWGLPVAPVDRLSYFELGTLAMRRGLVRELRNGMRVLEIGTGPYALLARWARTRWRLRVTATEIEPRWAVAAQHTGVDVRCCDLFDGINEQYDAVWFVPPMTPIAVLDRQLAGMPDSERRLHERRASGGVRGWELIDRYLGGIRRVLAPGGRALVTVNAAHVDADQIVACMRAHGLAHLRAERMLSYYTFVVG